jgi:cephalosporin hydroxylase
VPAWLKDWAYAGFVSVGSWIIATDGVMQDFVGARRTQPEWSWNNPQAAAVEFLANRDDFRLEPPVPPFNEGAITQPVTYWPGAWLKRIR